MKIYVQYEDTLTSNQHRVVKLDISKNGIVTVSGWGVNFVTHISKLSFSKRIGNLPRKIIFHNGAIGYSSDNDGIDKVLKEQEDKFTVSKLSEYFYNFLYFIVFNSAILSIIYGLHLVNSH